MMQNSHNFILNPSAGFGFTDTSVSVCYRRTLRTAAAPTPAPSPARSRSLCGFFLVYLCMVLFGFFSFNKSLSVSAQCFNDNGFPKGIPSSQALTMWVSSSSHTGALGGRSGANELCRLMQPASWTSAGITSKAMLSYSDENLIEVLPATVDIINTKGQCIAANREDLFSGYLLASLLYDETGKFPPDNINVFTATTSQGYKSGLGVDWTGPSIVEYYDDPDNPDNYCSDFSSVDTVASLGKINRATDVNSIWIQADPEAVRQSCAVPSHIYCITTSPAPTSPTVAQDPQFVGLQGQRFQVHGIPEEYFNLVSHPFFQLNSHFTYLATGICNYNDTACWSHPGTYVDELGLMLPGYEIGVFAGEHQNGLTVTVNGRTILHSTATIQTSSSSSSSSSIESFPFNVQFPIRIDNDTINSPHTAWLEPQPQRGSLSLSSSSSGSGSVSNNDASSIGIDGCTSCWLLSSSVSISFLSRVHLVIDTPVATLDIYNADHFFNFGVELRAPRLLLAGAPLDRVPSTHSRPHTHTHATGTGTNTNTGGVASAAISPATSPHPIFPMHGLVGQTWKNVKYPHGRLYAGEVDDYILSDRRLFSTNFVYNEYQY